MATDDIDLSEARSRLEDLDYPIGRQEAAERFEDTTVVFSGGGEASLGNLISEIETEVFDDSDSLYTELQNVLPVEAVGEPGQSEGEG